MSHPPKRLTLLGSTGSIGTQALDVVRSQPGRFTISALSAHSNADLLIQQALEFRPVAVVIGDEKQYQTVKSALADQPSALADQPIEVLAGAAALEEIASRPDTDVVLTAMVGYAGLLPTVRAIRAGKTIALANKETLVVAGQLITRLVKEHGVGLYPVDSEHSAIFQCLVGEEYT